MLAARALSSRSRLPSAASRLASARQRPRPRVAAAAAAAEPPLPPLPPPSALFPAGRRLQRRQEKAAEDAAVVWERLQASASKAAERAAKAGQPAPTAMNEDDTKAVAAALLMTRLSRRCVKTIIAKNPGIVPLEATALAPMLDSASRLLKGEWAVPRRRHTLPAVLSLEPNKPAACQTRSFPLPFDSTQNRQAGERINTST